MIRVGYETSGYREQRNILDLPHEDVEFVRVRGLLSPLAWAAFRLRGRSHKGLQHRFVDPGFPAVDLRHLFFSIVTGTLPIARPRPWVVSFSSWIPRWRKGDEQGLRRLARTDCRALLPISEHARNVQMATLEQHPDIAPAIAAKTQVILPAQVPLIEDATNRPLAEDRVDIAFVGHHVFRKGGDILVRVVARLLDEGAPLRLHLVSRLDYGDYASKTTADDVRALRAEIAQHPRDIVHRDGLTNADVLDLLRRCHVAAMPTQADTFGYLVLEAQACGCPVISTDVQALPEVNDDSCGWLLRVPVRSSGHALRRSDAERRAFGEAVETQLEATLRSILEDPAGVRDRGRRALARIVRAHDPRATASRVRQVYAQALGR